jgi:hypothetical protein
VDLGRALLLTTQKRRRMLPDSHMKAVMLP